jgi:glycosyltransferase involved in cell wall biosynthesis
MPDRKVTVALMTRNRPQLLRQTLESVLAQERIELDVVVLDNASSDDTPHVVSAFADPRITYLRNNTDIGIVRNWNRAIAEASSRSPFVSIFHDDDLMLPGFLAESARGLDEHRSAGMSLCLAEYINADGSPRDVQSGGDVKPGLNDGRDFLELCVEGRGIEIPPPIVLFRADALRRAGWADSPHTRGTMDMNLYYRVAADADVLFIPKPLVRYRLHAGSDTELINRTAGGSFWYGTMAERIDAIAALMRSNRSADPAYRNWLAERLLIAHAHQSTAIQPCVAEMYHTWDNRKAILLEQLEQVIPRGERIVLVDEGQLGLDGSFGDRPVVPFLFRNGQYWGAARDSRDAIDNLEELRSGGVRWLVIAWPSLWWLDQYGGFDRHIRKSYRLAFSSPHAVVFDLTNQ